MGELSPLDKYPVECLLEREVVGGVKFAISAFFGLGLAMMAEALRQTANFYVSGVKGFTPPVALVFL